MSNVNSEREVADDIRRRMHKLACQDPACRILVQEWEKGPLSDKTLLLFIEHTQAVIANCLSMLLRNPPPISISVPRDSIDLELLKKAGVKEQQKAETSTETQVGKYGSASRFEAKLRANEPWFGVRGQDALAVPAMEAYAKLAQAQGCHPQFLHSLQLLIEHMQAWQAKNQEFVKLPD